MQDLIQKKDTILLVDNCNEKMIVSLKKSNEIKWRKKRIDLKPLYGQPFNAIFEVDTWCKIQRVEQLQKNLSDEEEEEPELQKKIKEDNRELYDTNNAQKLTNDQIFAMKKEGITGDELIQQIQQQSTTFEQKTLFSQQKFIKKKQKKHIFQFAVYRLTLDDLVQYAYLDNPFKISGLRNDALALFMHQAHIVEGLKCLVVEDTKGLILAATSQKLNKNGNITLYSNERSFNQVPNYQLLQFTMEHNKCIRFDNLSAIRKQPDHYDRLLIGGFNATLEIIQNTFDSLQSGCIIVAFNQFIEPLTEAFKWLIENKRCILVTIQDVFTREYQVLPQRTHPLTQMQAFSGYVLSCVKTNPETQ